MSDLRFLLMGMALLAGCAHEPPLPPPQDEPRHALPISFEDGTGPTSSAEPSDEEDGQQAQAAGSGDETSDESESKVPWQTRVANALGKLDYSDVPDDNVRFRIEVCPDGSISRVGFVDPQPTEKTRAVMEPKLLAAKVTELPKRTDGTVPTDCAVLMRVFMLSEGQIRPVPDRFLDGVSVSGQ